MNASTANTPIDQTSVRRHRFSGAATIDRINRPTHVRVITAVVCASTRLMPGSCVASVYPRNVAVAARNPVGTVKRSTRRTNPGRNRRALGASAKKKDGMPIVIAPINVRCLGKNGKTTPATPTARESSIA
jgi:hypothetical protein